MNLQLREQQLKTILYTYRLLYQTKNLQLMHKQGISEEVIYLIVNKCIIHHEGGILHHYWNAEVFFDLILISSPSKICDNYN